MINTNKLERLLLQLTIFLIPSNLAYHWVINDAYINGRLIDYLLPKLYASDITLLGVIGLFLFNNSHNIAISSFFIRVVNNPIVYFLMYLIMRSWFSPIPLASYWYVSKIIEFCIFGWYLHVHYTTKEFLTLITKPLIASMIIQSITGLYQFINQSSLFGYIFMGEPSLKSVGIVKNSYFGLLEKTPYGTTAHPNVFAGYIAISSLLLLLRTQLIPNLKAKKTVFVSLISLNLLLFYLTQSLGAFLAFTIGITFINLSKFISKQTIRMLILMYSTSALIFSSLVIIIFHQLKIMTDNPSINTRYELIYQSLTMIQSHLWFGVGPNMFTNHLTQSPIAGQKSVFLQPVHNGLLLIMSEIGFIGVAIIVVVIYLYRKTQNKPSTLPLYLVPISALAILVSIDHYPLTLQTGQLLSAICIVLAW